MAKITEKEHIMTQEELEEPTPAEPTPDSEPEEPTEPDELGITLPDDAPPVEQVSDTDRMLGFDADGNPTTATAEQLAGYARQTIAEVATPVEELAASDRLLGLAADAGLVTATAEQVAAYAHATAPTPAYRNLCMNSRGETLNCWDRGTSHGNISIDTEKFGYPVIKNTKGENTTRRIAFMVSSGEKLADNYPELAGISSDYGGTGLERDITISYDLYPTFDCEVIYEHSGAGEDIRIPVVGNRWNHVVCTLPAGFTMSYFRVTTLYFNGSTNLPLEIDTAWYLKNIQIEWGDTATPYTYNPTIPYSLREQAVLGEFWNGRQVYVRSFKGTTPQKRQYATLMNGVEDIVYVQSSVSTDNYNSIPPWFVFDMGQGAVTELLYGVYSSWNAIHLSSYGEKISQSPYFITIKYTKA